MSDAHTVLRAQNNLAACISPASLGRSVRLLLCAGRAISPTSDRHNYR